MKGYNLPGRPVCVAVEYLVIKSSTEQDHVLGERDLLLCSKNVRDGVG